MPVFTPPRRLLFGAGPSQIPERVYRALSQPIVGHLDPFFFETVEHIRADLRPVFGTQNPFVNVLTGTGSIGMEASLSNFVEAGQKLAVFVSGFFAERMVEMGKRHGANVVRFDTPWGETASEEEATAFIQRERPHAVAFVHAETSTGALQNPLAITKAAHAVGAITIADCVTSLGAIPIQVDDNKIDVAFACSQKGMSCPPGLSPITVSPRGVEYLKARKAPCPIWYVDLKLLLEYYEGGHRYHHTAPISSFYALREGLAAIFEEGVDARFARHQAAHNAFVKRAAELNLEMFIQDPGQRIPNINTIKVPAGSVDGQVRKRLIDKYGIEIAAGFGPLAGKILRIGLMGPLATEENANMVAEKVAESAGA